MSLFAKRLKELRLENKLTQDELGAVINFTRAAISGYEIGRNEPSIEDLNKLAKYFNVSTDYLMGHSNDRNNKFTEAVKNKPDEYHAVIEKARGKDISPERLSKLIDLLTGDK